MDENISPWKTKAFRWAIGGIIAVGALMWLADPAPADELDKMTEQMFAPVVQLNGNCSGAIIHSDRDKESGEAETFVLTAKHCLSNKDRGMSSNISMFDFNSLREKVSETRYTSTVFGKDYKSDLAIVQLNDKNKVYKNVALLAGKDIPTKLRFGQEVYSVGYPMGLQLTYTKGNLGNIENLNALFSVKDVMGSSSGRFYRATPATIGGNSGGPLFTKVDGDYKIIGVTTAGWQVIGGHMNYFTPLDEVHDYLNKASKAFKTEFKIEGFDDEE